MSETDKGKEPPATPEADDDKWSGNAGAGYTMLHGELEVIDHTTPEQRARNAKHDEMMRQARKTP
jgi:hypothetical protein